MPLVKVLREMSRDERAASYQLLGEDLALIPGARLREAAEAYEAEVARHVPGPLRARFEAEQEAFAREAHGWLRRYSRSVHGRIRGYLALGRLCRFEYPWPVVAVLGICQVLTGFTRTRLYGLLGSAASRAGHEALGQVTERIDEVLRRTNRGIFADSVPTVLLALRAHDLRARGEGDLAEALLCGPPPPTLDDDCRDLARALFCGLAIPEGRRRFEALADLTLRHFGREQAIFTYHMGSSEGRAPARASALLKSLTAPRAVPAPVVERTRSGRRVVFRPYRLPPGFEMTDHAARVEAFGRAFVRSVTSDPLDYRAAVAYVVDRFGEPGERATVADAHGPPEAAG